MTERKFREIFKEIGWKVRLNGKPSDWSAWIDLKSPDGKRSLCLASTAFDSEEEWSRRLVFERAEAALTCRPMPTPDGSTEEWQWPCWFREDGKWFVKGELYEYKVYPPPWFQNLETGEVLVSSVEEFAFKLSALGF